MVSGDTIVAISSAVGAAARMIVRVSGPGTREIAGALVKAAVGEGGSARRCVLGLNDLEVPCWIYSFVAPRSYTGEDLVEFHLPGNPLLARMLVDELVRRGARAAEAGEFTARAYFNGRMDLTEAEGVAATIAAHGEEELRAARQLLAGELARRLRPMMDELAETLALVETGIDFSDEDVTFLSPEQVVDRARRINQALGQLVAESARFERLSHEPRIVLTGRPNSGKSTLLNALAGAQRAIVSPVAGTTRDVLTAEVALDRGMVIVADAAGLEERLPPPEDQSPQASIARQMHERALSCIEEADIVVLLHEAGDSRPMLQLPRKADLAVTTKVDQSGVGVQAPDGLAVSAVTGENMDVLRRRLSELAFGRAATGSALALNSRHVQAIDEARYALARLGAVAHQAGAEVVAMELREAINVLGRIVGQITPDDLLGKVFARFCIGK